jgi:hypothetical protein
MGMALDDVRLPRPEIELGPPDWFEYLRILGAPPGLLSGADHAAFHVLVARLGGENGAAAMAFDLGGQTGFGHAEAGPPGDMHRARLRQVPVAPVAPYFVNWKLARWKVPSSSRSTSCRQVFAQLLSVFQT